MKKSLIIINSLIIIIIIGVIFYGMSMYEKIKVNDGVIFGKLEDCGKEQIVMFISGSGSTDMNGNSSDLKGRNDNILQLSKELYKNDISSFRYDKRNAGKTINNIKKREPDFDLFIEDSIECIRYLKKLGYKKIYIAGHSQGALVAMLASQKEKVDGLILLSGTGFTIDKTLEKQFIDIEGENSKNIEIINSLRKGTLYENIDENDTILSIENQKFILSWMKYDPVEIIQNINCPTILVQGKEDTHIDIEDFNKLKENSINAQAYLIENMNHLLKKVKNKKQNSESYIDPSYNIHEELINIILEFIL